MKLALAGNSMLGCMVGDRLAHAPRMSLFAPEVVAVAQLRRGRNPGASFWFAAPWESRSPKRSAASWWTCDTMTNRNAQRRSASPRSGGGQMAPRDLAARVMVALHNARPTDDKRRSLRESVTTGADGESICDARRYRTYSHADEQDAGLGVAHGHVARRGDGAVVAFRWGGARRRCHSAGRHPVRARHRCCARERCGAGHGYRRRGDDKPRSSAPTPMTGYSTSLCRCSTTPSATCPSLTTTAP